MTLSSRLRSLSERIARVSESANGRNLTNSQKTEFRSVLDEFKDVFPEVVELAASDTALAEQIDNMAAYVNNRDLTYSYVTFARHIDDLAQRVALVERAPELDAARAPVSRFISHAPTASAGRTSSIAPLWAEYRSQGFAARDIAVSPGLYETRALGAAGGSAIATTFADQVVVYERTLSPMLNPDVVTISTSPSGAPFKVPRLTADVSYGGTVIAEAGTIPELDPTTSAAELTPYKYGAITLWSAELDEDEIIELEPLIARSTGRELAIDAGVHLTTGDGSGKPTGFITSATNGGTAAVTFGGTASTFFDYGDLVSLWGSVAAEYRSTGVWQLSNTALVKVLTFRDDDGQRVLLPGLNGGPPTIMGRPVYENPAMAAVASASKSVAFGDFKGYWVRRVVPMRVELSRDYKFNTDQVALKVIERLDGELVDTAAVAYLVSANT